MNDTINLFHRKLKLGPKFRNFAEQGKFKEINNQVYLVNEIK